MHHKIFEYTSQDIKQTFCTLKDFKYISHCFEGTTQDFVKKKYYKPYSSKFHCKKNLNYL